MATYTKKDSFSQFKPGVEWKDEYSNLPQFAHGYYDDDYLNEISQYKDKSWYNQLLNNPWLAGNQSQFSPTWWQSDKEDLFGDYSARDAYNADLTSRRSEWLSNFLEQMRQQEYNEPSAQVERESLAGLNPDLNGNISPGQASENDQPLLGGAPMLHDDSDLQMLWNLGSSTIGTIFQVASSMQGLVAGHLQNKLKKLEAEDSRRSFAKELIKDSLTEYYNGLDSPESIESHFENGAFVDGLTKNLSQAVDKSSLSHSDKKKMRKIIDGIIYNTDSDGNRSFTNNFQKMVHDSVSQLRESRNKRAQSSALPGAFEGDSRVLDIISNDIYKPILDAELDLQKLKLKFNKDYFSTSGLGSEKGLSEKAQYQIQQGMLNIKENLLRAFESINKRITGSKDISPSWKLALQAGLASAEAYSFSKLGFKN